MHIYYFNICKRKLWLFSHNLNFEDENIDVKIGKVIEEESYSSQKKNYMIDNINIDYIKKNKTIHEIKKSNSFEEANIMQIKYYLYILKEYGLDDIKGILEYPKLYIRKEVHLDKNDDIIIEKQIDEIYKIINDKKIPNVIDNKICKKCAYYEYCYV
ncbi:CRISPR-associated protein Cas4 [Oceanotoga teriensis]|jgi:CRISPR-associated exonuclease Cas4|uniref:CRISPR-associated exonuclease Cas4 n=1 Tax=Oceanotoga teriensis TaxID=515440 RepID=A0AA45C5K8_9BACT|nr:CRISPR-associated protein Cas4 [Oceanotoga teriensis]MDO7976435.1 CRISPR-associated protein Cas4 [Oceanotoga teriensis]PWJ88993.1 CRISPR-associated exonuclease Cas4 [Oceanotoga teriensis]